MLLHCLFGQRCECCRDRLVLLVVHSLVVSFITLPKCRLLCGRLTTRPCHLFPPSSALFRTLVILGSSAVCHVCLLWCEGAVVPPAIVSSCFCMHQWSAVSFLGVSFVPFRCDFSHDSLTDITGMDITCLYTPPLPSPSPLVTQRILCPFQPKQSPSCASWFSVWWHSCLKTLYCCQIVWDILCFLLLFMTCLCCRGRYSDPVRQYPEEGRSTRSSSLDDLRLNCTDNSILARLVVINIRQITLCFVSFVLVSNAPSHPHTMWKVLLNILCSGGNSDH